MSATVSSSNPSQLVKSIGVTTQDWAVVNREERRQKIKQILEIFVRLEGRFLKQGKTQLTNHMFWVVAWNSNPLRSMLCVLTDANNKFYQEAKDLVDIWRLEDQKMGSELKSLVEHARLRNCCIDEL